MKKELKAAMKKFKQGQIFEINDGNGIIAEGMICGIDSVLPNKDIEYIVDILSGNIDKTTYPYTHILCPEKWLKKESTS